MFQVGPSNVAIGLLLYNRLHSAVLDII